MKIKLLSLILLFLIGCRKPDDQGYKTYTIKEGKHRSTYAYHTSKDTSFSWSIIFDSSAIYTTQDSLNQYDINKLIGWSDCGENHMEYSMRFGWRWLHDSLEIHWFKHENGHFSFAKICSISLCEPHEYHLVFNENKYDLCVDGNCVSVDRTCSNNYRKYKLYPYFGGQEVAPHDIKIKIK
tara:strand:- start:103 stop:645 length:543 start_codon:yes stop_codon:yes gene_type:complete